MKKSIVIGILISPLVACSTSQPSNSFNVRTADFSKATDNQLCIVYGYRINRSEEAKLELVKRKIFTDSEWKDISKHQVSVGMSECAVKAAYSINYKKVINTQFINGDTGKSFIYSCHNSSQAKYCPYTKIDIINGRVESVSTIQKI